jgi:hypothetical protein
MKAIKFLNASGGGPALIGPAVMVLDNAGQAGVSG